MIVWKWIAYVCLVAVAQDEGLRQWTGRKLAEDGTWVEVPQPQVRELRQRLEEAWLQYELDRDTQCADEAFARLWIESTAAPVGTERVELWAAIVQKRARLALETGRPELARELWQSRDAGVPESSWEGYEVAAGSLLPRTAAAVTRALEDVELPPAQGDPIDRAVRAALESGQSEIVYELGERALPVLERASLENTGEMPRVQQDPLIVLFRMAEMRGARFALEHWEASDYLWKKRVLRAMERADVLDDDGTWRHRPDRATGEPGQLIETIWHDVLERLVADREIRREAIDLVGIFVDNDALTPGLQESLAALVQSSDADSALGTAQLFQTPRFGSSLLPVYEAMLASDQTSVRRLGAERLLGYRESNLAQSQEDPDPAVRLAVAKLLQVRHFSLPDPLWSNIRFERTIDPSGGTAERAAIARLVGDPDPAVRREAARSVIAQEIPFEVVIYEQLASDPDVRVRRLLVESQLYADDATRARVFEALADDPDPDIRRALDQRLIDLRGGVDTDLFLGAAEKRLLDEVVPPRAPDQVLSRFAFTDAGLARAVAWALASEDPRLLTKLNQILTRKNGPGLPVLSTEDCVHLLEASGQLEEHGTQFLLDKVGSQLTGAKQKEICMRVLADERFDWNARLRAAAILARSTSDPEVERAVVEFLENTSWDAVPIDRGLLGDVGEGARRSAWPTFPTLVLESAKIPDSPKQWLLLELASGAMSREWYVGVLERWLTVKSGHTSLVRAALQGMAGFEEIPTDLLVAASHNPTYVQTAVAAMVRSQRSAFNEAYVAILREEWPDLSRHARTEAKHLAVQGLTANLDAEAAGRLLDVIAWVSEDDVREWCFEGLETIRRYEYEQRRWREERDDAERRERARVELVAMLGDEDSGVREMALRSLAAIAGSEALPHAVTMLRDEAGIVREAARKVIETVGEPQRQAPAPERRSETESGGDGAKD